ncbi:hypothetical protein [Prevotella sp.]
MMLLSHSSEVMDARDHFYQEMRHQHAMVVLRQVGLGLLVLCSLMIVALCAYMYGLIG